MSVRRAASLSLGVALALQAPAALAQMAPPASVRVSSTSFPALASASAPPSLQLDTDLYVLGPGDGLTLTFLDPSAAGVGGAVSILPDGTSTLALLGSVQLTGLTIAQATRWLTSLYARQLVRPELTLSLTAPRPVKVSILGEVEKPGLYPLASFSTAVSAIQQAGGITLNADVHNVILRRRLPGPDGAQKQTTLDLGQLLQLGNQRQNPILFDGDTVMVSRSEKPLPSEIMQLAATNLSPGTINVQVNGEVKSPGGLSLPANIPLVEAILRAGGPTNWRADKGNVELIRLNRDGTTTREVFTLNYTKGASNRFNPPLRNNDIVVVHRSLYGKTVDVLNQLILPLATIPQTFYWWTRYR